MSIRNSKFVQSPFVKRSLLFVYGLFWSTLQHGIKSDRRYLSLKYRLIFHKKLRWDNPQTFNEKLNWLKVNFRQDIMTRMADKIEAKNIVAEKIGSQYVIPLIGTWGSAEDIDFSTLPDKYVLKCNHNSGGGYVYMQGWQLC